VMPKSVRHVWKAKPTGSTYMSLPLGWIRDKGVEETGRVEVEWDEKPDGVLVVKFVKKPLYSGPELTA